MLILGRRINQSIVFPNCGITVRILDVNGRVAKVGIEAPKSVAIMRGELAFSSHSHSSETAISGFSEHSEQYATPEEHLPVLQFAQRLAQIKAGLHLFQQRRAAGDETGADQVFGDLLNELANLDADSLKSLPDSPLRSMRKNVGIVSEPMTDYAFRRQSDQIQILVVNESNNTCGLSIPAGTFHGCQVCTVNNRQTALQAIVSNDRFDYVVCNDSSLAFDELDLVRTIRSNRHLDSTKIFMTSVSECALEHYELSCSYRIDGWLSRPLLPNDLWKHIVESQQFES